MGEILERRRGQAAKRVSELQDELSRAGELCKDKACVYVIGSFGRGEASGYSDLDLFIASRGDGSEDGLSRLNEVLVKAELIEAARTLGLPDFSGDGEYLKHYTVESLVRTLGRPEDDATNTFTARVLLLLESRPLLEEGVYRSVVERVISAYWRDYPEHAKEFVPAFLANDILRLWRTFCVNYEARTSTEPPRMRAKRKLKNYKLKHSRLLTCYSGLLHLLAVFSERHTVTPTDAFEMTRLAPTERLQRLLEQSAFGGSHGKIEGLLEAYERFLADTEAPEEELVDRFLEKGMSESADQLGDLVFEILDSIGDKNAFHRLLVV